MNKPLHPTGEVYELQLVHQWRSHLSGHCSSYWFIH